MSKTKISMFALAFVLAAGAAFATKSTSASSAVDCVLTPSGEDPKTYIAPGQSEPECPGVNQQPCCTLDGVDYNRRF